MCPDYNWKLMALIDWSVLIVAKSSEISHWWKTIVCDNCYKKLKQSSELNLQYRNSHFIYLLM